MCYDTADLSLRFCREKEDSKQRCYFPFWSESIQEVKKMLSDNSEMFTMLSEKVQKVMRKTNVIKTNQSQTP